MGLNPDEIRDAHLSVAEWLQQRGQQFVAQGEAMIAEAAEIRARAMVPEPSLTVVPPVVVDEPPVVVEEPVAEEPVEQEPPVEQVEQEPPGEEAPPAEVESIDPKPLDGKRGKVGFKEAIVVAAKMKEFSRREFADELGVSVLAVSKFLTPLTDRGIVRVEGARYVASDFAGSLTLDQRKALAPTKVERERAPVEPPRTPSQTHEDEFPENLRYMPAAKADTNWSLATRIEHATKQKTVCDFIHSRATVVRQEVVEGTGLPENAVKGIMDVLEAAGFIRRTGEVRHREGGGLGRPGVEYASAESIAEREQKTARLREYREDKAPDPAEVAILKRVRDYAVKQPDTFSDYQCAEALELPTEVVVGALEDLTQRGILSDDSPGTDFRLFTYVPPTSAGRAAEIDQQRKRALAESPANGGGGEAVAGTGKKMGVTNPEVRALVTAAQKAGAKVDHATNGHYSVVFEVDGAPKRILIAATPSGSRTVLNDRARLRRAGLAV